MATRYFGLIRGVVVLRQSTNETTKGTHVVAAGEKEGFKVGSGASASATRRALPTHGPLHPQVDTV